jgi:dipeptidyl aminopeptidase/acylaminoacyl peptidase
VETGTQSLLSGVNPPGILRNFTPPIWSPNGRYLLYSLSTDDSQPLNMIGIYDLETQKEVFLSDPIDLISLSGWSFDSSEIAFIRWVESENSDNWETVLEILDVMTKQTRQWNSLPLLAFDKAYWSPATKDIVIFTGVIPHPDSLTNYSYDEIYLFNSLSDTFEQLKGLSSRASDYYESSSRAGYYVNGTPWLPNGQGIVYSDRGLLCHLDLLSNEESCLTDLTGMIEQMGAVGAEYPTWSPTNEWVGFIVKFEGLLCGSIAVVRPDGTDLRFTDAEKGECSLFGPIWSPVK